VGAGSALTGGLTPDLLLSVPVFVEVAWSSPSLRLRLERGGSSTGADFTWTAGSLDTCPVAWSPAPIRLSPCLRLRGGLLEATGEGVVPVRSDTRRWLDFGALVRARLDFPGPFFFELEGGASIPATRDRFFVEPDATIHRAPLVMGAAAAGAGVSFP
jgi:hypothetical protein